MFLCTWSPCFQLSSSPHHGTIAILTSLRSVAEVTRSQPEGRGMRGTMEAFVIILISAMKDRSGCYDVWKGWLEITEKLWFLIVVLINCITLGNSFNSSLDLVFSWANGYNLLHRNVLRIKLNNICTELYLFNLNQFEYIKWPRCILKIYDILKRRKN